MARTYERDHLKNRAENSGDSALWSQFKTKRNHINDLRVELKADYYQIKSPKVPQTHVSCGKLSKICSENNTAVLGR